MEYGRHFVPKLGIALVMEGNRFGRTVNRWSMVCIWCPKVAITLVMVGYGAHLVGYVRNLEHKGIHFIGYVKQ